MKRASPVDLRNALEAGQVLVKAGIGFICVPYSTEEERFELTHQAHEALTKMEQSIDQEDK